MPAGRSDAYTIIEIAMMEGRSVAARKNLIHLLFERVQARPASLPQDLEICIQESPAVQLGLPRTARRRDPAELSNRRLSVVSVASARLRPLAAIGARQ